MVCEMIRLTPGNWGDLKPLTLRFQLSNSTLHKVVQIKDLGISIMDLGISIITCTVTQSSFQQWVLSPKRCLLIVGSLYTFPTHNFHQN